MKKVSKVLLLSLSAVLLVTASVLGTLAYLTGQDEVVNSFTVGSVAISLDEAKVDEKGAADTNADRVNENTYKLIPGHKYDKDPIVHVAEGSEDCYLFVKVENGISQIEGDPKVANQIADNNWTPLSEGSNIYAYAN
ncbi:MAG: hypothetical protein Q4E22_07070, partial [Coriobacteriia bacterium]|nr:hypothetical protein [Coriobacteriia bacterium]